MLLMLAVGASIALSALAATGCSHATRSAIERAVIDCTAPARADAVAAVTPAVESVMRAAASADGKLIDVSTVKQAISKANVLSEAGVLLSCAAASAIAIIAHPLPAPPGSPAAAELVIEPAAAASAWAAIKRDQLGGADFRITGGEVL